MIALLAFFGGWASCIAFIAAWGVIEEIYERRQHRIRLDNIAIHGRAHGDCPWNESIESSAKPFSARRGS